MSGPRKFRCDTGTHSDCDSITGCEGADCDTGRRRLLAAIATGGSLALAGCTGVFGSPEPGHIRGSEDSYTISFQREGTELEIGGNQTVLRAGEDAGIDLPSDCRAGFCGVCLARADRDASDVVEMSINDYDPLNEAAVEAGYFLPCTSQPRGDFTVTTGVDSGELDEFQPDDDNDDNDDPGDVGRRHAIRYINEGWIIPVGEQQDLLRAAEGVGLDSLPYQCREGRCGACLSRIDGDANELVEHWANRYGPLDEDAMADGYVLTCTAQPRGTFELETNRAGDL